MAMDSFFLMGARPLVEGSPSMKLHELLDWGAIAAQLKGLYQREISGAGGPEPYSPLGMFKLMLLGQWHGLSDAQLEQALRVRLDFMVFTGFEPSAGELPDASTICRFRNRLVKAELDQKLLTLINSQLEQRGLKVQGARGAIIDATIIPSAARPRQHVEDDGSRRASGPSSAIGATRRWTARMATSSTFRCIRPTRPRSTNCLRSSKHSRPGLKPFWPTRAMPARPTGNGSKSAAWAI